MLLTQSTDWWNSVYAPVDGLVDNPESVRHSGPPEKDVKNPVYGLVELLGDDGPESSCVKRGDCYKTLDGVLTPMLRTQSEDWWKVLITQYSYWRLDHIPAERWRNIPVVNWWNPVV